MKQNIARILRDLQLLSVAEKIQYLLVAAKHRRTNRLFSLANAGFKVPPQVLAFDAYSAPHWDSYKESGGQTAALLLQIARRYFAEGSPLRVLDWGCGPARVIRHLPAAFGPQASIYGSDYNPATIKWCIENIHGVSFSVNDLLPPLPFAADFIDFVYSLSVFTHLSESVRHRWIDELRRITHTGSILVITTQGDSFLDKLLPDEVEAYRSKGLVVRGKVSEGKRIFSAFHSPRYLTTTLFRNLEVLELIPGTSSSQDMWILRKPPEAS